jgi:hypothetical protein
MHQRLALNGQNLTALQYLYLSMTYLTVIVNQAVTEVLLTRGL